MNLRVLRGLHGAFALLLGIGASGCRPAAKTRPLGNPLRFSDVTTDSGIQFTHTHGGSGKKLMPETVGSGCAWLDYDGDGWQDLLLVNCAALPGATAGQRRTMQLYRNLGNGKFEDRTADSGLEIPMYGQGVTAADYDGDGDPDLFVTCLGPNHLFRNEGHGKFLDVTQASGLNSDERWSWHTGAAWLDYDRDGILDLFVARYVKWIPETDQFCGIPGGLKRYCPPWKYLGETCLLYHGTAGGKFQNVSQQAGLDRVTGKWFQPLVWDYDSDGWPDVVVTSDGTPTALFRNDRTGHFLDTAAELGVGLSETGMPKSGMGIDIADWRNNDESAVLIGNFSGERLSLFEPAAAGLFEDNAGRSGLGEPTLHYLTFGLAFLDVDNDGWRDAFIGNGHIDDYINQFDAETTYEQRPLLFRNVRGQHFEEVGEASGSALQQKLVVRGLAVADYDHDGDPDVLLMQNNREARLYRNETGAGKWLRVELRGSKRNRDAIGAQVEVTANGTRQRQWVRAGGHYLSQSELPLLFGLGDSAQADVKVTWPDGTTSERPGVPTNQAVILEQGR